jgi:DNA-binding response OmpR family regulator
VLLDIMMPHVNGYEVLAAMKASDSLRHIPVIMISAVDEIDSVVRCIELGAEDYLPKPFNPTLLPPPGRRLPGAQTAGLTRATGRAGGSPS